MTTGFSSFALGGGATQKQRVSYFYDGNNLEKHAEAVACLEIQSLRDSVGK